MQTRKTNPAKKAQGASNATEQMPNGAQPVWESDELYEEMSDVFRHYHEQLAKSAFQKKKVKNTLYSVILVLKQKGYPFSMVFEDSLLWFDTLNPEYILNACNSVYSNSF